MTVYYAIGDVHGMDEMLEVLHATVFEDMARQTRPTRLVHLGDEGLLDAARAGVAVDVGENGQWRWGRRASGADITRLIAMTLAVDGIQNADTGPNIY
jgi:hypothetical protein